jgi:hypothetical protein
MFTLKDFSMTLRVIGILYLFYLQYVNSVDIPISIVILISLGSLGSALACKTKVTDTYLHPRYYNYLIALGGILLILKEYM